MNKEIEKVKKLKGIYLEYEDGSVITMPETQSRKVGSAFMKIVAKEKIEWHIVKTGKPSIWQKIKKFIEV